MEIEKRLPYIKKNWYFDDFNQFMHMNILAANHSKLVMLFQHETDLSVLALYKYFYGALFAENAEVMNIINGYINTSINYLNLQQQRPEKLIKKTMKI